MPKETNKKQKKEKKHFMKDFKAELKRVIWPSPKQLLNNTVAVITIVLITAAIVFALDFMFESINTYGIDKLKSIANTTNNIANTNELINIDSENNSNVSENNTTNSDTVTNETKNEADNANNVEE